jgi:hypothetical protein
MASSNQSGLKKHRPVLVSSIERATPIMKEAI